ncbi:thioredoxin [Methanohalophilus halophilus]|uniref:Thioredoxin n=2 Tax=Methanohalophilus halophilus TaxID=2177 RepID=A0A1H2SHS0_9EURY|nr:thioredoxin [Methanohalophilus halophilus]RNI09101.1 thioredoxin [Methanohalophilus halophilus]SDW31141.1 thioredoxin [Methanohalophilus halophilus]
MMGLGNFIKGLFGKGEPAMSTSEPVTETINTNLYKVNSLAFEQEVVNAETPVIVDCFAKWCAPCKKMAPMFEETAAEYDGQVKFVIIDLDKSKDIAKQYNVVGIPTLLLFDKGEVKEKLVGNTTKDKLKASIEEVFEIKSE